MFLHVLVNHINSYSMSSEVQFASIEDALFEISLHLTSPH